jgi:thiosulfate reductase cytochrome b subunit
MPGARGLEEMIVKKEVRTHTLPVRISHWLLALSIVIMIGSGCRIYDAMHGAPGIATAFTWHFAGLWLLLPSFLLYILWGMGSGHFQRDFLPVSAGAFRRDFVSALRLRLEHRPGEYNAVQKVFYWVVLAAVLLMIVSGIAMWEPVQTYPLEVLFGGFQGARLVHFLAAVVIMAFLLVHLTLVILAPSMLVAMIVGRRAAPAETGDRDAPSEQQVQGTIFKVFELEGAAWKTNDQFQDQCNRS